MSEKEFREATEQFYKAEYQRGLPSINRLLESEHRNSNLYLNRGVFYSQMQRYDDAKRDIHKAVMLNPRNYIAYFNLFSLHYRNCQDEAAFHSLCCSLSCLYLMKAKNKKDIASAERALKYCKNNVEAHLLKGLLLLEQNRFLQSYYQLEQATAIDPLNEKLFAIKSVIFQKAYPSEKEVKDYYCAEQYQDISPELKCSLHISTENLEEELTNKLVEFNRLYQEAVTEKVPRDSVSALHHQFDRLDKDSFVVEDQGQKTPPLSEVRPLPGQIYMRQSRSIQKSELGKSSFMRGKEESQFSSIVEENNKTEHLLKNECGQKDEQQGEETNQQFESLINESKIQEQKRNESLQGEMQVGEDEQQVKVQEENHCFEDCNLIYPLDDGLKLGISVVKLQFSEGKREKVQKLKDVYCLISYNNGKAKLTTPTKSCQELTCYWNHSFQAVDISPEPTDMKLKIYNKKYSSVRDEFLGDIEVLITTADMIRLPVFDKKGEEIGQLLIALELKEIARKAEIQVCDQ